MTAPVEVLAILMNKSKEYDPVGVIEEDHRSFIPTTGDMANACQGARSLEVWT